MASPLEACPYCGTPAPSLSEQVRAFDVVVLGKYLGGKKPDRSKEFSGTTQFKILETIKDEQQAINEEGRITRDRYSEMEPGQRLLIFGNNTDKGIVWAEFVKMTPASFQYFKESPPETLPTSQRLAYFLQFLEHSDRIIAADAFSEFAVAPYEDVRALAPLMNPEQIRGWLANPKEPADRFVRIGFFGLLLGLCGTEADAEFLRTCALSKSEDYSFGIDGMTSGYLILTQGEGFKKLMQELLTQGKPTNTQLFPLLQALRFMWTYESDDAMKVKIRSSMRQMLDHTEIVDLAIIDLTRWKDWESMDQIASFYHAPQYNHPQIKRAILRYLLTANTSNDPNSGSVLPKHIRKAEMYLEEIKQFDPKTYRAAQRYFIE